MTDETTVTPDADSRIAIDAENVLHDGERATRHGLAHLEDEFVAECKKIAALADAKAKKLLAWIASKL